MSESITNPMPTSDAPPAEVEATDDKDVAAEPEEAAVKATPPPAPPSSKRKLKVKIDGEEHEEEIDLDDEEELTKRVQLAKVAQKRMAEYAELKKDVIQFIEDLRKNPKKALSDPTIGLDLKKFAAQIIEEEIENSKKSPQQLEKERLEAELKALKEEQKKKDDDFKAKEFERLREQEFERYDILMEQALTKTDLPKTPYIVKKIADYMLIGLQNNKDVKPEDVIPLVREEMKDDLKQMFAIMPDEAIEAMVGKDVFNRIRKKNVAKAKQAKQQAVGSNKPLDVGKTKEEPKQAVQKKTFKDFFGV